MTERAYEEEPFGATPMEAFLEALASTAPTPGGGSAAAFAGSMGCALGEMAAGIGLAKEQLKASWPELKRARLELNKSRFALLRLVEEDSLAYERVTAAYKLPRATESEKEKRREAIQHGLGGAAEPPLKVMEILAASLPHLHVTLASGPETTRTDVLTGVALCRAVIEGARLNAEVNITSLAEGETKSRLGDRLRDLLKRAREELSKFES